MVMLRKRLLLERHRSDEFRWRFLMSSFEILAAANSSKSDSWTCQMDIKEEARIRTGLLCPSCEPLSVEHQDKLMARSRVTYLEKVKES